MKKFFVACLLISFFVSVSVSQNNVKTDFQRPNFNGIWIPKAEKEKKPDVKSDEWTNFLIKQDEPEIKFTLIYPAVSKQPNKEFKFFTDARGEINNNGIIYFIFVANKEIADDEVKSVTKWDGSSLVITHKMVVHNSPVTFYADLIMRWELSNDGKTLTRTMKTNNFSATYLKGDKLLPLQVPAQSGEEEFKDEYVLLKGENRY